MTKGQKWAQAKGWVGRMVEVGRKVGPAVHGRLEYISDDVDARSASVVLFVKDSPEGVEHKQAVRCRDIANIVLQPLHVGGMAG